MQKIDEKFNFDPANALFSGAVGGAVFALLICINLFPIALAIILQFEIAGFLGLFMLIIMGAGMGGVFGGTIALLFGHRLMNLLLPMGIFLRIILTLSASLIISLFFFLIMLFISGVNLLEFIKEPIIIKDIEAGISMFFNMTASIFFAIIYYSKRGNKVLFWNKNY